MSEFKNQVSVIEQAVLTALNDLMQRVKNDAEFASLILNCGRYKEIVLGIAAFYQESPAKLFGKSASLVARNQPEHLIDAERVPAGARAVRAILREFKESRNNQGGLYCWRKRYWGTGGAMLFLRLKKACAAAEESRISVAELSFFYDVDTGDCLNQLIKRFNVLYRGKNYGAGKWLVTPSIDEKVDNYLAILDALGRGYAMLRLRRFADVEAYLFFAIQLYKPHWHDEETNTNVEVRICQFWFDARCKGLPLYWHDLNPCPGTGPGMVRASYFPVMSDERWETMWTLLEEGKSAVDSFWPIKRRRKERKPPVTPINLLAASGGIK